MALSSPQDHRSLRALDRPARVAGFGTRLWSRDGAWRLLAIPLIPVQYLLWAIAYAAYAAMFITGATIGLVLIGIGVAAVAMPTYAAVKALSLLLGGGL